MRVMLGWLCMMVMLSIGAYADARQKLPIFRSGDIIFQSSSSDFSMAIGLATDSVYTHMGIIYQEGEDYFVYEAVQPVRLTPLAEWIDRGRNDHYVVKRLKNADEELTEAALGRLFVAGAQYAGKDYDSYFGWSDQRIYCSELVWKMYDEALDIQLGKLAPLRSYDLDHELVQQKLLEHYGKQIPYDEMMIAPETIFQNEQLEVVWSE